MLERMLLCDFICMSLTVCVCVSIQYFSLTILSVKVAVIFTTLVNKKQAPCV